MAENKYHATMADNYFNNDDSNLWDYAKGAYHWVMSKPYLLGNDDREFPPTTGIADFGIPAGKVANAAKTAITYGKEATMAAKTAATGAIGAGARGALQGGIFLANNAKKVSDGSKYADLVEKTILADIKAGRLKSSYLIEKARQMRMNNASRITEDMLTLIKNNIDAEMKYTKVSNKEAFALQLFNKRFENLILGHTGRLGRGLVGK